MKCWCLSIIAGVVLIAAPTQVFSEPPKQLGKFRSWVALQDGKNSKKTCYVYAEPFRKIGRYTKRGDVFVEVLHAPAEKVANEVLFITGYTYKKGSTVTVNIGGRKFRLFTEKDAAWPAGRKEDLNLVRAMRKGRRMVVRGRSWRGTLTTDTYSLMGFTAAHRAASAACNVRLR